MIDGGGFQRGGRVEPAPRGQSQFPRWATVAVIVGIMVFMAAVIAALFLTGGLAFR
jgi:hypothetical protein